MSPPPALPPAPLPVRTDLTSTGITGSGSLAARTPEQAPFPAQVYASDPQPVSPARRPISPARAPSSAGPVPQPPPWPPQNAATSGGPSWRQEPGGYGEPYGEEPEPRRKRTGLQILGAVLALILVAGLGLILKGGPAKLLDAVSHGGSDAPPATTAAAGPSTGAPATPAGPFAGTPAAGYPEGDAGITLPAGTAVPGFTAAQVDAGLQQVKQALVAARLDPTMLTTHDPTTLLKLLSPQAGKEIKPYFDSQKFFGFATQVAPGYSLTTDKIRVSGKVTFKGNTANGVRTLQIVTNFVWIYPFAGALQQPGDHLVIMHDEVTWAIPVAADVDKAYRGLRLSGWTGLASNMDCDLLSKSLLALGKPQFVTTGAGDNTTAFDPSESLTATSTC